MCDRLQEQGAYLYYHITSSHIGKTRAEVVDVPPYKPPLGGPQDVRLLQWLYVLPLQPLLVPGSGRSCSVACALYMQTPSSPVLEAVTLLALSVALTHHGKCLGGPMGWVGTVIRSYL